MTFVWWQPSLKEEIFCRVGTGRAVGSFLIIGSANQAIAAVAKISAVGPCSVALEIVSAVALDSVRLRVCNPDEADVVVDILAVLVPEVHDHAFGADRSAGCGAIFDVVLGALVHPAAVRVVAVVASVVKARSHVDAHGHPASFNNALVLPLQLLVDEVCGALFALGALLIVAGALVVLALLSLSLSLSLALLILGG